MFILTCTSVVVYILLLFWITIIFSIHVTIDNIVMFALMIRISTLVRIIPGNLGVQELFSGGAYHLLGGNLNDGLAIALFVRFIALVLTISIGVIGVTANVKYFEGGVFKEIWGALTQRK